MNSNVMNTVFTEMSEKDQKKFKKWLRGVLKMHETTVVFVKKDGTERKMRCTLNEESIPSEFAPKNTGKAKSDDAIAVFDLEKEDWRSFRWDSVKEIKFSLEKN